MNGHTLSHFLKILISIAICTLTMNTVYGDDLEDLYVADGSTYTLNSPSMFRAARVRDGSSLVVNAPISTQDTAYFFNGATITNNAPFAGNDDIFVWEHSTFNLNNPVTTPHMRIMDHSTLNINAQLTTRLDVDDNSTINVNHPTNINIDLLKNCALNINSDINGKIAASGGVINQNSGTLTGSLDLSGAVLNRINGDLLLVDGLELQQSEFTCRPTDNISSAVRLHYNSTLSIERNISGLNNCYVSNSVLNLNGYQITTEYFTLFASVGDNSALNKENGGSIRTEGFTMYGKQLSFDYSENDSITSALIVGYGSTFNTARPLNLSTFLYLAQGGSFNGTADVNCDSLIIGAENMIPSYDDSDFNFTQSLGHLTGVTAESELTINSVATLNLIFDSATIPGQLDWAFRLGGNNISYIESLIASNINVFGAPQPVSIIYEPSLYGDYTYIGYIAAVLEPSLLIIAGALALAAMVARHNFSSTSHSITFLDDQADVLINWA